MENIFLRKLDDASSLKERLTALNIMIESGTNIKGIFNELTKRDYFNDIAEILFFYLTYNAKSYRDEIFYLLKSGLINFKALNLNNLYEVLTHIREVLSILIDNLYMCNLEDSEIIRLLTKKAIMENNECLDKLMEKVFLAESETVLKAFILEIAREEYNFDFERIMPYLFKTNIKTVASTIACSCSTKNLDNFLNNHFEELLLLEKEKRMTFIYTMKDRVRSTTIERYNYLLGLLLARKSLDKAELALNIVLKYEEENFIKDYIENKSISALRDGSSAIVYSINQENVLKLARFKHNPKTVTEHFLLAPTTTRIITENNIPILYMEKQQYLDKVFQGIPINDNDLDNFFFEVERQNLLVNDPHCVHRLYDNFGFLKDYRDATLVGVSSYEELPDWFKKRPLVLFDIDMVMRSLSPKKRIFL